MQLDSVVVQAQRPSAQTSPGPPQVTPMQSLSAQSVVSSQSSSTPSEQLVSGVPAGTDGVQVGVPQLGRVAPRG